ncbi:L,D-transpeptidase [Flavobacteriales bacterium]|nr:L,D-transpeptidase [Flavobacteriales bacterium]
MGLRILIIILTISFNLSAQENIISLVNGYMKDKSIYDEILFVSVEEQNLYHIKSDTIFKTYRISSSKLGKGNKEGSNKTPTGLHIIKEKYGNEAPINGRFIGRVFYGNIAEIYYDMTISKTDDITSRILWLAGLENGVNKGDNIDSYKRYIYIHGTSEEGRIGIPSSHGCIRMQNKDVIDLFNVVSIGTFVLIL